MKRDWSRVEKAIVDAHCTTSADKWAFVSIAINDRKGAVGSSPSTAQSEEDAEEPEQVYETLKRSICKLLTAGEAHCSRREGAVCVFELAWSNLTFSDLQHPLHY